jgi:rhodanese-related sulfurtransferase
MKIQLTAIILAMSVYPLAAQDKKPAAPPAADTAKHGVKHADAAAAKKLIDDGAARKDAKVVVLDIRTPEEYKDGHIAGAVNIDFKEKDFAGKVAKLDREKTYVVHCQGGGRSTKSLETLKKLGFKSIVHLDNGFGSWQKAGLPVEK